MEEKYKKIFKYLDEHDSLKEMVILANNWITLITYIAYPLMIIRLLTEMEDDGINDIVKMIVIPVVGFILLSVVRKLINAERPYEKYNITPLVSKDTKGCSFPSRHVFSIFIISMGFLYVQTYIGVVFLILGAILAICRVLVGVHFPKDVIVGTAAGIICGLAFFL